MQPPRPAPKLGRHPQQFTQSRSNPIPPMLMGQPQLPPMQTMQSVPSDADDLAMEIYCRLAVDQISSAQIAKPEILRALATAAKQAAAIYFEEVSNAQA